eukprot:TCONS_00020040-protein
MPKRLCPFNGSEPLVKAHIDMRHVGKEEYVKEVHHKTTKMLLDGARQARREELKSQQMQEQKKTESHRGKINIGPVFKVLKEKSGCYFCKHNDMVSRNNNSDTNKVMIDNLNTCSYCNKNICHNTCSNICTNCQFIFCPSCCEMKYGHFEDAVFCVNCLDFRME